MKAQFNLRKSAIVILSLLMTAAALTGCAQAKKAAAEAPAPTTPDAAIAELVAGNQRFANGEETSKGAVKDKLADLSNNGQHPFATVLTCSDSRVSPELLFDQGLGRVFVIRDAGNVTDEIMTGSAEYAAEHLKTPLLLVLAHEKCGAVKATVDGGEATPNIESIIEKIEPSVEKVMSADKSLTKETAPAHVEEENALNTVNELMESPVLKHMVDNGQLKIVAAKYDLDTGLVEILK